MGLPVFTVTTTPTGAVVRVNDTDVPVTRAVMDSNPGGLPTLTLWADTTVTGEGIVQLVRDPTPAEIDTAAVEALRRVDVAELTAVCEAKVRAGRRDPYAVALETIVEMADG